jgi:hypothetical protein
MGLARWYNAQKVTVQAAVIGGVLAITGGLITGGFSIVNTELAKPDASVAASAPTPTLTMRVSAPATSSSATATATSSHSAAPQISRSPSSPSSTPATPPIPLTAAQIAQDTVGRTATNGSTVTTAHCSQGSVQLYAGGSTQADCDLTFSNNVVLRASVTVYGDGSTTWSGMYQENLTAADVEEALVGRPTTGGWSVISATCYQSTLQKEPDGSTQVECVLTLGNNTSYETTVTYNGISAPTWS